MANSLLDTIKLLEIPEPKNDNEKHIVTLCQWALDLVMRERAAEAIVPAQDAVRLAEERPGRDLHGIALLHLSLARHSSSPRQSTRAVVDCEEAIINLGPELHNYCAAEMFRAQLELRTRGWDANSKECAVVHLQRAEERLNAAVTNWRTSNRVKEDSLVLLKKVNETIEGLVALVEGKPTHSRRIGLVWPDLKPSKLGSTPASSVGLSETDAGQTAQAGGAVGLDYFLVSQITVNGQLYAAYPDRAASTPGTVQFRLGRKYYAYKLQDNGEAHQTDEYVLLRQADQADRPPAGQLPSREWKICEALSTRVMGEEEREWRIVRTLDELPSQDFRVIGVFEAVLKPVASNQPPPPSPEAGKTSA
jgi:hypothetical protein